MKMSPPLFALPASASTVTGGGCSVLDVPVPAVLALAAAGTAAARAAATAVPARRLAPRVFFRIVGFSLTQIRS
jgi:hypothetical protein